MFSIPTSENGLPQCNNLSGISNDGHMRNSKTPPPILPGDSSSNQKIPGSQISFPFAESSYSSLPITPDHGDLMTDGDMSPQHFRGPFSFQDSSGHEDDTLLSSPFHLPSIISRRDYSRLERIINGSDSDTSPITRLHSGKNSYHLALSPVSERPTKRVKEGTSYPEFPASEPLQPINVLYSPLKGRRLRLPPLNRALPRHYIENSDHLKMDVDTNCISPPTTRLDSALECTKGAKLLRRMAAFEEHEPARSTLKPVKYPGRGRILLTMNDQLCRLMALDGDYEEPSPPPSEGSEELSIDAIRTAISSDLSWPDGEHPWNCRDLDSRCRRRARLKERLVHIERYLNTDSEDEMDPQTPAGVSFDSRHQAGGGLESADAREVLVAKRFAYIATQKHFSPFDYPDKTVPEVISGQPILVPTSEDAFRDAEPNDTPFFMMPEAVGFHSSPEPRQPTSDDILLYTPTPRARRGRILTRGPFGVDGPKRTDLTPFPTASESGLNLWSTPSAFGDTTHLILDSPFDPTSTPSRGLSLGFNMTAVDRLNESLSIPNLRHQYKTPQGPSSDTLSSGTVNPLQPDTPWSVSPLAPALPISETPLFGRRYQFGDLLNVNKDSIKKSDAHKSL